MPIFCSGQNGSVVVGQRAALRTGKAWESNSRADGRSDQQNAALVEEAAAAGEAVQEQAQVLMHAVGTVKLDRVAWRAAVEKE